MQEIVTEEELLTLLNEKEMPVVYLGNAITGRPHIGYFAWVVKLYDFLRAGLKVKLLLADLHGSMDNCPWELLDKRYEYYSAVIPEMLRAVGAPMNNLEIVKGSKLQMNNEYFHDLLKMSTLASVHDAKKASSEVVKQSDSPKLSGLIYPLMQALDEQYLNVDIQYGGVDQRKILMFAREYLPKLNYRSRIEIMTPMIPGLADKKMSASNESSKIDVLDSEEEVNRKISKAVCAEGVLEDNSIMALAKYVIMPLKEDRGEALLIERPDKYGGNLEYFGYELLEKDFVEKTVHPMDLKNSVAKELNRLLHPIREALKDKKDILDQAY